MLFATFLSILIFMRPGERTDYFSLLAQILLRAHARVHAFQPSCARPGSCPSCARPGSCPLLQL